MVQLAAMNRLAFLALAAAGILWGLGFPLGKLVLNETSAAHMVLLRFAVAAVVSLPFVLRKEALGLFASPVLLVGGALYAVAFLVQFEGLAHVSVTLAALLVGAMPALIAISARLLGEPVSRAAWLGVAAATLGAALIAGKPDGAGSPLGVALSLGALLLFLAWIILMRRAPKPVDPMAVPAVTVIVAALVLAPVVLLMHGPPELDLSPVAWTAIIAQGGLSTLFATAAWQYGLSRVGSASAGVFINIEPMMGAVLGVMLFGDHLTAALAIGGLMILAGSFVVVLGDKSDAQPTPV